MHEQKYIKAERKLNDFWALALYVIAAITYGCCIYQYLEDNKNVKIAYTLNLPSIITSSAIFVLFTLFNFVGYLLFPRLYIKFACVGVPILSVPISFLSSNMFVIVFACIGCMLSLFIYFMVIRKHLSFIIELLKVLVSVVLKNVLTSITTVFVATVLLSVQIYFYSMLDVDSENYWVYGVFGFLVFSWTFFNCYYAFQVFVCSIIALELVKESDDESTELSAMKNMLHSLGSVCFGGLLLAIVVTLKKLVRDRGEQRSRRDENSLSETIVLCLLVCLLSVLEDIVRFANEVTFPYMAVHGTGYIESVKGGFSVFTSNSAYMAAYFAFKNVISANLLGYVFLNVVIGGAQVHWGWRPDRPYLYSDILGLVLPYVWLFLTYTLIQQMFLFGGLSIIYTFMEKPELVKKNYPKLAEEIEGRYKSISS